MEQSLQELAEELESYSQGGSADLFETERHISVSRLSADATLRLADIFERLRWPLSIEDQNGYTYKKENIEEDFGPFKVVSEKPVLGDEVAGFITVLGFKDWLNNEGQAATQIRLFSLKRRFDTFGLSFLPWDEESLKLPEETLSFGDPRKVVRELTDSRSVPKDIARWILKDNQELDLTEENTRVWVNASTKHLLLSLANEIEAPGTLVFKGSPTARATINNADILAFLQKEIIQCLHEAARWVFAGHSDVETRHTLFSAEVARCGQSGKLILPSLAVQLKDVLAGAQIAHELGLQKLSADALKAMSDVRKAVSDEATKLADATRQLAVSTSGALFGGIGLIVARFSMTSATWVSTAAIIGVAVVLAAYVYVCVATGRHFISVQRDLRAQWRNKLYRFLPESEYAAMVELPARNSENGFKLAANVSLILAAVLLLSVVALTLLGPNSAAETQPSSSTSQNAPPRK